MLKNNVEQLLKAAVRKHLSDEELGAYNENAVDEIALSRMKSHLSRCWICDRRLTMMQEMLEAYSKEPVTDEDIAMIEDLLHREPKERESPPEPEPGGLVAAFVDWWRQRGIRVASVGTYAVASAEAYAAGERAQPQDGQTEDGALRWRVVEDEWGDLVVRFGSHRMELEGVKFVLKAGPIPKEVFLEAVTDDQVGAEVIFTREERTEMPEDIQLTVDILNND